MILFSCKILLELRNAFFYTSSVYNYLHINNKMQTLLKETNPIHTVRNLNVSIYYGLLVVLNGQISFPLKKISKNHIYKYINQRSFIYPRHSKFDDVYNLFNIPADNDSSGFNIIYSDFVMIRRESRSVFELILLSP